MLAHYRIVNESEKDRDARVAAEHAEKRAELKRRIRAAKEAG